MYVKYYRYICTTTGTPEYYVVAHLVIDLATVGILDLG
jgi:hypothetical protein